jgi:hypothetical protein
MDRLGLGEWAASADNADSTAGNLVAGFLRDTTTYLVGSGDWVH